MTSNSADCRLNNGTDHIRVRIALHCLDSKVGLLFVHAVIRNFFFHLLRLAKAENDSKCVVRDGKVSLER